MEHNNTPNMQETPETHHRLLAEVEADRDDEQTHREREGEGPTPIEPVSMFVEEADDEEEGGEEPVGWVDRSGWSDATIQGLVTLCYENPNKEARGWSIRAAEPGMSRVWQQFRVSQSGTLQVKDVWPFYGDGEDHPGFDPFATIVERGTGEVSCIRRIATEEDAHQAAAEVAAVFSALENPFWPDEVMADMDSNPLGWLGSRHFRSEGSLLFECWRDLLDFLVHANQGLRPKEEALRIARDIEHHVSEVDEGEYEEVLQWGNDATSFLESLGTLKKKYQCAATSIRQDFSDVLGWLPTWRGDALNAELGLKILQSMMGRTAFKRFQEVASLKPIPDGFFGDGTSGEWWVCFEFGPGETNPMLSFSLGLVIRNAKIREEDDEDVFIEYPAVSVVAKDMVPMWHGRGDGECLKGVDLCWSASWPMENGGWFNRMDDVLPHGNHGSLCLGPHNERITQALKMRSGWGQALLESGKIALGYEKEDAYRPLWACARSVPTGFVHGVECTEGFEPADDEFRCGSCGVSYNIGDPVWCCQSCGMSICPECISPEDDLCRECGGTLCPVCSIDGACEGCLVACDTCGDRYSESRMEYSRTVDRWFCSNDCALDWLWG